MNSKRLAICAGSLITAAAWLLHAAKLENSNVLVGKDAWADSKSLKPGLARKITVHDLPEPMSPSPSRGTPVPRPANAWPQAPAGFKVDLFVSSGLAQPRQIRTAPNGDFFVADSSAGEIKIFRGISKDSKPEQTSVFASGLNRPFGIAFYPPGPEPRWVYVGNTNSLVRFPYHIGD